ncbi:hypothetical protein SAMN04488118_105161 [Epibacterium ulvae]|uniref:Uncharacterized protein n=1 Tax=Epibacterium ulvae TaxID=1156985 RepID=A0A1G5QQD0_9RHOB|nr:hypothetical protein [Epibacterium ulvae]SCZ63962.1 hypothetical protein SAMN04488118_105161 [Epibacterium ulvae]
MEVVKDIFDAFSERLRSPFLGSILLAFAFWNWQVLWFMLFADVPVADRIAYFDAHTDGWQLYLYPILSGVAFAVFMPWLRYAGAEIAKHPNARLKQLQSDEARERRIAHIQASIAEEEAKSDLKVAQFKMALAEEEARIAFDAAVAETKAHREQELIEDKKRLDEAREVGVEEELQETRKKAENLKDEAADKDLAIQAEKIGELPFAVLMLRLAADTDDGELTHKNGSLIITQNHTYRKELVASDFRQKTDLQEAFNQLAAMSLFLKLKNGTYRITKRGFDVLDYISANTEDLENA